MIRSLSFQAFVPDEAERLTAFIRRLVPHNQPELEDAALQTALAIDAQCVGNFDLRAQISDLLQRLDDQAQQRKGTAFVDLPGSEQDELLKTHEGTPLFQQLLHLTRLDFYNRHVVWNVLGYPGLDRRLDGEGYRYKGFDQLDWPEMAAKG